MKKLCTSIIFLLFALVLPAQQFLPEYHRVQDTAMPMELRVGYHVSYQTSSLPNYFVSYFLKGGTISNDIKNNVSNGLKNNNTGGFEQVFGIRFTDFSTHPFKDKNLGYYLNIEHQDHLAANFSRDAFNLAFYGNGPYSGQTLNLAPVNYTQFKYQKIGVGFCDARTGSSAGISLVKGQTFSYVNFSKADFFTDDSTANISLDYSAEVSRSDTGKINWSAFNGAGVAVDLSWNFKIFRDTILPDLNHWQFRLQNAGFITWNNASLYYGGDSSIRYNGFSVDNILKPDAALFTGGNDLNDTLNIKYTRKKFFSLLPADVVLGNVVNPFTGRWLKPLVGVRYKLMEGYKLMPYLGAFVRISKNMNLQATGSYGGFGGFRFGLKYQAYFGKRVALSIGTSGLDGLVSSNRFGKDGYFAMQIRF